MAKQKHTREQEWAIKFAKIERGGRRKAALAAGEYDGRFAPRFVESDKLYKRAKSKRHSWEE